MSSQPSPPDPTIPDPALAFWNTRYGEPGYFYGTEPNGWLAQEAPKLWKGGDRVLVVADGEGRNGVWLAEAGLEVVGFDASPPAVEKAQALAQARGVSVDYRAATVDTFPWEEGTFDGVVGIFIQFAGPGLRARLFHRMVAALRPGGHLLLLGYTPEQLELGTGGPSDPSYLYTEPLLRSAFSDLRILALETLQMELHEGRGHQGPSALIRFLGEKPPTTEHPTSPLASTSA
jgi:SAM-dependent methyltransferase